MHPYSSSAGYSQNSPKRCRTRIHRNKAITSIVTLAIAMLAAPVTVANAALGTNVSDGISALVFNLKSKAFVLTNSSDALLSTYLADKSIDGVALQEGWAILEPTEGSYSWRALDSAITLAQTYGKKVSLHIMPSPAPSWLQNSGAQYYTGQTPSGQSSSDVVPWDSTYLSKYKTFIQDLASHLDSAGLTGTVFDVSMTVPVPEMNLVACNSGKLGDVAYDRSAYLDAWEKMGDAYQKAFPKAVKFVSAPQNGMICAPTQDYSFYTDLMTYLSGKHRKAFWLFAADLTADGSQRMQNYLGDVGTLRLGYQTIWSASNDPSNRLQGQYPSNLQQAICAGRSNGARYFEIYAADVLNTNSTIQKGVRAAHRKYLCQ